MSKHSTETIHDRRNADLPINSAVMVAIVPDPYSTIGEKLEVLRSVRDDPLAGMHSRNQIDDAQFAAGRRWQRYHEQSEIGSIQAIDPAKEAVDGGRMREMITDRQIDAFRQLADADQVLGQEGKIIIREILVQRKKICDVAADRGYFNELEIKYIGRRFRECLETLAILWGYAASR